MSARLNDERTVAAFSHIPKTAGLQVARLLQRYHGARHLAVKPSKGHLYQADDLRFDLRVHRHVVSLTGHSLRPYIDYGAIRDRLSWYTILRNPVDRYLSHFMHEVEHGGKKDDLAAWIRENPNRANVQVRTLAGSEDITAAIEVLNEMAVIGFVEELTASLVLVRSAFSWNGMDLVLPRSVNVSTSGRRAATLAAARTIADEIAARNELDRQLYEYARTELWPKQVARFGATELQALTAAAQPSGQGLMPSLKRSAYLAYRHAVQRPLVWGRGRRPSDGQLDQRV